jgi:hypothetical protein
VKFSACAFGITSARVGTPDGEGAEVVVEVVPAMRVAAISHPLLE